MRLTAFLALFLAACAPVTTAPPPDNSTMPPTAVRLSAERVSPGAVRLTLDNGERDPIGYNLCTSDLQRRSGTTWTAVETGEVCTMQLLTLNPGADATFEKQLPANLAAGEYRYTTSVESPLGTTQVVVATNPFRLP